MYDSTFAPRLCEHECDHTEHWHRGRTITPNIHCCIQQGDMCNTTYSMSVRFAHILCRQRHSESTITHRTPTAICCTTCDASVGAFVLNAPFKGLSARLFGLYLFETSATLFRHKQKNLHITMTLGSVYRCTTYGWKLCVLGDIYTTKGMHYINLYA